MKAKIIGLVVCAFQRYSVWSLPRGSINVDEITYRVYYSSGAVRTFGIGQLWADNSVPRSVFEYLSNHCPRCVSSSIPAVFGTSVYYYYGTTYRGA